MKFSIKYRKEKITIKSPIDELEELMETDLFKDYSEQEKKETKEALIKDLEA